MKAIIPEIGTRFGHLTVIDNTARMNWKRPALACVCRCDCGQIVTVQNYYLRNGMSKSCGCHDGKKNVIPYRGSNGESQTRLCRVWISMLERCNDPHNSSYSGWGGRGIKVCDEWSNSFTSFKKWALENGYTDELTIDRIDVNGNYEPSNCRWATQKMQNNNKRNNRVITFKGKTQTESMWAEETGINRTTLQRRLDCLGWSVERALTEPTHKHVSHKDERRTS